jgi:rhamnogalacturonyl hydrolase YesR
MERVADWQLAHPSSHEATDWTQAAGDAGIMALAGISGSPRYREELVAAAERLHWQLGPRMYDADDHCIGQTYAELYRIYRDKRMIEPLRERFESILAKPSSVESLAFDQTEGNPREIWSWCDSLFMGPPAWFMLAAATGDTRYSDFAAVNWWGTTEFLYDKQEHLFFRDSTYFNRREANGRKIFWSRGNGWVMAGLVRTLQNLPQNYPDRSKFEDLFKEMAVAVLRCQQPDGLWRASLLDPGSYPLKEASGSGFYVYALAWGINQGLLDRARVEPAVMRGWAALVDCVQADGKLTHVQPIGADPRSFKDDSTEVYGVGAFLLAGSEVYRMSLLEEEGRRIITLRIRNPGTRQRSEQTIEVCRGSQADEGGGVIRLPIGLDFDRPVVFSGDSSRILPSQAYSSGGGAGWDTLVFQVDLAPGETRLVQVVEGSVMSEIPTHVTRTYARQVPERFNDVAWESDRTAHRVYHTDLIKGEGTTSSGIDVWSKSTRRMIIDEWYRLGDYHNDHGDGMDDYRVGMSRGCGGIGIWSGGRLFVSSNFSGYRLLTSGPVRSEFELRYDAWDAAGRRVSEVRTIRIDAGSNFSRASSLISSASGAPLELGIGLALREGDENQLTEDQPHGTVAYWQAPDRDRGSIGCALVVPKGIVEFVTESATLPPATKAALLKAGVEGLPPRGNELAIVKAAVGRPTIYFFGSAWSKGGDFATAADWSTYVSEFAEDLAKPVSLEFVRR